MKTPYNVKMMGWMSLMLMLVALSGVCTTNAATTTEMITTSGGDLLHTSDGQERATASSEGPLIGVPSYRF